MAEEIRIELTAEARELVASMQTLPARVMEVIAAAMDKQNVATVAHIKEKYLSFPKAGPVSAIGLRVQSNRLRGAAAAVPATISGTRVESGIGDSVKYAKIHEFGGTVKHAARKGKVRLATTKAGELLHQVKNGNLAVFAKRKAKYAKEVEYEGKAYEVDMPARGMFRRGIKDRMADYSRAISEAVIKAL